MARAPYGVVIASLKAEEASSSVESLRKLPKEEQPSEILLSVGRNPSQQRNLGVRHCKSPFVYFLDDDSSVIPGTPTLLVSHFKSRRTSVAGGPNLPYPNATGFEKTVSAVLASWLGSFKVRNRYVALGSVKEATEKDLILCNMMVRREAFEKQGGFRADLYPNEENEFLNRLMHSGQQLIYDPGAAIYRPRRKNLGAFCYQSFRYGRGRARQIKVYPCLSDLVHLVPAFFLFYVLSLFIPLTPLVSAFPLLALCGTQLWRAPLYLFLTIAFGTGISVSSWHRRFWDAFKVPALIFLRHFFYGLGLLAGFVTPTPVPEEGVKIYRVLWSKKGYKLSPLALKGTRP